MTEYILHFATSHFNNQHTSHVSDKSFFNLHPTTTAASNTMLCEHIKYKNLHIKWHLISVCADCSVGMCCCIYLCVMCDV